MWKKLAKFWGNILLFIGSVVAVYIMFGRVIQNIVITAETTFMPYMSMLPLEEGTDYFWRIFLSSDHSWFFVSFLMHLFSRILPVYLDIHPQSFYLEYGWYAFFLMFYCFCFVLATNFAKYLKIKFHYFLLFFLVILFCVAFCLRSSQFMFVLYNDSWHLCYILNPIFALLLFQNLEKIYVTGKQFFISDNSKQDDTDSQKENNGTVSRLQKGLLFVLLIFMGMNHELLRFVLLGGLFFSYILHKIFIKTKFNEKSFILYYLLTFCVCCFSFCLPTFANWYNASCPTKDLTMFLDAICAFIDVVLVPDFPWIISFIVLSIATFFLAGRSLQVKKLLITQFSAVISLLIFNYLIIWASDCRLDICQHNGILFLTKIMFLYSLLSVLGFVFEHCYPKLKKLLYVSFAIFFCYFVLCFAGDYSMDTNYALTTADFNKKSMFVMEKFYSLYGKEHNLIYAFYPDNITNEHVIYYLGYWYGKNKKPYNLRFLCKWNEDKGSCMKKVQDEIYKKTNYVFSKGELLDTNFDYIKSYQDRKEKGKIFVDLF